MNNPLQIDSRNLEDYLCQQLSNGNRNVFKAVCNVFFTTGKKRSPRNLLRVNAGKGGIFCDQPILLENKDFSHKVYNT